jgi:hypothetical protein
MRKIETAVFRMGKNPSIDERVIQTGRMVLEGKKLGRRNPFTDIVKEMGTKKIKFEIQKTRGNIKVLNIFAKEPYQRANQQKMNQELIRTHGTYLRALIKELEHRVKTKETQKTT